jgi:1-acyl-sn-glycerol-3-phosphate acyltransferase
VFSGHTGFIRLALRTGVPVVPVVGYGGHQSLVVLSRGEHLARVLGLGRLRIKVFPILLGPWGVTSILTPPPPLPSAITVEFMPPIDWSGLGPDAAEDRAVISACYEEITQAMQVTLDRLYTEQPHPVLRGISHLLRGPTTSDQLYV